MAVHRKPVRRQELGRAKTFVLSVNGGDKILHTIEFRDPPRQSSFGVISTGSSGANIGQPRRTFAISCL